MALRINILENQQSLISFCNFSLQCENKQNKIEQNEMNRIKQNRSQQINSKENRNLFNTMTDSKKNFQGSNGENISMQNNRIMRAYFCTSTIYI